MLLEPINAISIERICNSDFARYAQQYVDIAQEYRAQILRYGLPTSNQEYLTVNCPKVYELEARGLVVANDRKSLTCGWVSPSCLTCRKGQGTATFSISTQCSRSCFFCFNHNQKGYAELRSSKDDPLASLDELRGQGHKFMDLALTGGEPLLHKEDTEAFFRYARALYPEAYLRLYTSGDYLDEDYLALLRDVGLDEIRISVKLDDEIAVLEHTLDLLELSTSFIPQVMVEMPVMPDTLEHMKALLLALDEIGIDGINLLELCFPEHNAEEFKRRGYELKAEQHRVLYNYLYAGGLPIAGSEEVCLLLLEFALDNKLSMGVHYCSLENKFSGQVNVQNLPYAMRFGYCSFSEKDYFLKSAKVFGANAESFEKTLEQLGVSEYRSDPDDHVLEFSPVYLEQLADYYPDSEIGIGYHIVEQRGASVSLRELRVDYTTPSTFDFDKDI